MKMKKSFIAIVAILISFCLGFLFRASFVRHPSFSETHVIHYCSCIEDNPAAQKHLFKVAETANRLISEGAVEFAEKHDVSGADFETIILVGLDGNYKIVSWCSNRTAKVARLAEEFAKMAGKHLKFYTGALKEMHEIYFNPQTITTPE